MPEGIQRIDLHTHVFNVRYLPIAGILHQRGRVPKIVARGIAKLLNWRTGDQIEHDPVPGSPEMKAMEVLGLDAVTGDAVDPATALAATTPPELIDDPEVREALAFLGNGSPESFAMAADADFTEPEAHTQFARLYAEVERADRDSIFESGAEYLAWFKFLTQSERVIVDKLLQTYGSDVHLFVHHMMDMEHYYEPRGCYYDFVGDQLGRMKRLVNAFQGRLLTFVAWSPRRPNAINVVRRAITEGIAAGVKVYPPSGYQPDEAMNDALYDFCASQNVPLFAHCTPQGFEARQGFGVKSNPLFWRNVLHRADKRWKELRLCLAHAGGGGPWFGTEAWAGSFPADAVALASDPETPNVYLEFGYHDEILDDAKRAHFIRILAEKIRQSDGRLAKRIVYGTDWHMIEKIRDHERYFTRFAEAFQDPALAPFADDFFYGNAAEYLNLPQFASRRPVGDPVREGVERVIEIARARDRGR